MAKKAKAAGQPKGLKQPPIKGMEAARHTTLDKLCESLGDTTEQINTLMAEREGDKQAALDYMVKHRIPAYHHAGTEVVRRPGAEKLSVRQHHEATATMPGDEALGE